MNEEAFLLDKVLIELGCFDTSHRNRAQILKDICRLALKPRDPTATIVDGTDSRLHDKNPTSIQATLREQRGCETLILHNFSDSDATTESLRQPIAVKQLCLSKCSIHESTIATLSKSDVETLIIWNCNLQGLTALTSLKGLVVVDSYIPKGAIEMVLQNSKSLERVVLVRSGDMPNQQKQASFYLSPNHHHHHHCLPHERRPQHAKLHVMKPTLGEALLQSRVQTFALECSILPSPDLAQAILSHLHLTKLSLSQTMITDIFAFWLAEALRQNQFIQELNLKQVCWSPIGAMAIAHAIRESKSLVRLDLSETMWHGNHAKSALRWMLQHNTSLKDLQLNRLKDGEEDNSTLMQFVFQGLQRNETLTNVGLAGNYHHEQAERHLFEILSSHPSMERLDLSKSSPLSGKTLLGLSTNSTLREISLDDCNIGRDGAMAIGKLLLSNQTLQSIDLCHNQIDMEGCKALAQGLKGNHGLERIFLYGNKDLAEKECSVLLRNVLRDYNLSLRVIFLPCSDYQEELQYYGSINFAGRKDVGTLNRSSLWPKLLERASEHPDMLMFLLRQKPELFQRKVANVSGKKRSFDDFLSL